VNLNKLTILSILLSFGALSAERVLTLQEAFQRAVAYSPDLAAQMQEIGVKEGEVIQASLRPNPALDFEMAPILGSGPFKEFQNGIFTYEIQQLVETCCKREMRTKLAQSDKLVTEWGIEQGLRELKSDLRKNFVLTALAEQKVVIYQNNLEISQKAFDSVKERVAEGKETRTQLHKANIQERQSHLLLGNKEREFELSKRVLASYWNSEEVDFDSVALDLFAIPQIPDYEWIKEQLQHYPGYVKSYMEYNRAHHLISLERSNGCPDVLVSVGLNQFLDRNDYAFKVEFNVPIPIFNYNQGKITAAEHALDQAAFRREQVYLDFLNEIRTLYKSLLDAFYQATEYENNILATAQESFEHAREGFNQGKYHYIDMLDAQRTLFEVRDQFVSSIAALHIIIAELDKYTGAFTEDGTHFSSNAPMCDALPLKVGDDIIVATKQETKRLDKRGLPWRRKSRRRPHREVTTHAEEKIDDTPNFYHPDSSHFAHTVLVD